MQQSQDSGVEERYRGVVAKADPFFIRSTSLVAQQMLLRIGDYSLAAAPAYFSFEEVSLLLVLRTEELALFGRYVSGTCSLLLVFDLPGSKEPVRFLLRARLASIDALAGRANVCMARLTLKTLPPLYVEILTAFFSELEARKQKRELIADQWIEPGPSGVLPSKAVLVVGQGSWPVTLRSLCTKQVRLNLERRVELKEPVAVTLKLSRAGQVFSVSCAPPTASQLEAGDILLDLDFSNELVSLIEEGLKATAGASGQAR
ncbi:MAG TPA: hypothetical protein VMC79_11300 [Rectinemataceae bacterium]|nr:hypothetical protein [Rectinemataceae bacterium]